jgi:hypothetical protein
MVIGKDSEFPLLRNPDVSSSKSTKLVLFFGWLNASPRAVQRYVDLYHNAGYDVLYIPGHVTQFVWPANSVKLAKKLLDHVGTLTDYNVFLCHAISIGAYNYTSLLMLLHDSPEQYRSFKDRIQGVIFDSLTIGSTERMKNGVKYGLSQNPVVQFLIPRLLSVYLYLTYRHTLKFFETGVTVFSDFPLRVPTLFVYSRNDPMCDAENVDTIIRKWREDFKFSHVSFVCWTKSKHAMHIKEHKNDYLEAFSDFIKCVEGQTDSSACKSKL